MSMSMPNPVAVVALAITAFAIARTLYLALFHPLANVPGPKHYAATDLFYLYHSVTGNWPARLKQLHDQYGPTVRISPNEVSSITSESWKTIYGHKNQAAAVYRKDPVGYLKDPEDAYHILNSDGDDHRRMRRVLAHAFSEKALRAQREIIDHYTDFFIKRMFEKAASGEPINIVKWYNFTTFDLVGDLAFGKPFGGLENGVDVPWINTIFQTAIFIPFSEVLRRYPSLKPIAQFAMPSALANSFVEHKILSRETAMDRIRVGETSREDFMSYILRHNKAGGDKSKALSEEEIAQNASILILAGSETTATALSGATYNLLTNPNTYKRLVAEIRGAFSSMDDITIESVSHLEYLQAVINENFRMYPPVPVGLLRLVPKGGGTIDGYFVPEGSTVSVPQWAAYQSSTNFVEPDRFVPERWLPESPACYANDNKDVVQPFSTGPRNCIGKNLAWAELRLVLARLFYKFDLELMPESKNWAQQKVLAFWIKGDLMVKIHPVKK